MIPCRMFLCSFCKIVYLVTMEETQDVCFVCGGKPELYGKMLDPMADVRLLERLNEKEI